MDPKMEQVIKQVSDAIANGADPNQIAQQLMQEVQDENVVKQIMEAAMQMAQGGQQEGGGSMQGSVNTQREAQQLLETALGELGPEVLAALLMAYDALDDANKQALIQQLGQMAQQGKQEANGQPQEEQAMAAQENLFGGRA